MPIFSLLVFSFVFISGVFLSYYIGLIMIWKLAFYFVLLALQFFFFLVFLLLFVQGWCDMVMCFTVMPLFFKVAFAILGAALIFCFLFLVPLLFIFSSRF